MTIYADGRIPYFYVIQSKDTGKKYAGAKWGKDANPDLFMNRGGYKTSSNTVKKMLGESEGAIFSILEIITEEELQIPFGCNTVREYEQWFLESNDCCKSMDWLNKSRPMTASHDSADFKINMLKKYGVENCSQLPEVREKVKKTLLERTGYDHNMKIPGAREQSKQTHIANTGYDYPLQNPISMEKFVSTNLEIRGVEYPMQCPIVRAKSILKVKELYGEQYINVFQVPEIQEKSRISEVKTYLERYGVDDAAKIEWYCGQCDISGRGAGNLGRWHRGHSDRSLKVRGELIEYTKC